jgi:intracellular septation protein A
MTNEMRERARQERGAGAATGAPPAMKHWRTFGHHEWRHVEEGARGLAYGSGLPVLLFYVMLQLVSFPAAVVVVLTWSTAMFIWHWRRTGQADVFSASTFGFAVFQALIGLLSQNPTVYLAVPSLENLMYGLAFVGSALIGRPLLGLYAKRLYPIPAEVEASPTFRRAFLVVSLVWFLGLGIRALVRLWLLFSLPLELYLVVNTIAGWPFSAALVTFTAWYPLRELKRAGLLHTEPEIGDVEEAVEEAVQGSP